MSAKILIVDDEQDFIDLICHNLKEQSYEFLSATSGMEGLKKARRHLPDLILLDLMLPDIDGFSVCEILRKQPSTAHIPIILLSAVAGEIARANGVVCGAEHYVAKPFKRKTVSECIKRVLQERNALLEAARCA